MKDAWAQLDDLYRRYSAHWDFRPDLEVFADGPERHIKLNGVQHNVGTVRAYIRVLEAACDVVDAANPVWASWYAEQR